VTEALGHDLRVIVKACAVVVEREHRDNAVVQGTLAER
jgi:hypothetical protein